MATKAEEEVVMVVMKKEAAAAMVAMGKEAAVVAAAVVAVVVATAVVAVAAAAAAVASTRLSDLASFLVVKITVMIWRLCICLELLVAQIKKLPFCNVYLCMSHQKHC